jgi:hypothetical protein
MEDNYEKLCDELGYLIPTQVKRTIIVLRKEPQNLQREIRYLEDLIDVRDKICDITRNYSLLKETEDKY